MSLHHSLPHWNYYRLLERDLEDCFRYVAPNQAHYEVYSDQFARIILVACTEIENVLAALSLMTQNKPLKTNILSYHPCVTDKFPKFCEMDVVLPRFSLGLKPWIEWSTSTAPDWWSNGYNKIKHDRMNYAEAPTLIRAINSVGAL